jgi:hypothetical protein
MLKYYTISDNLLYISEKKEALEKYYNTPIYDLPEDYEEGKYIIGEVEEEIEVPDYDEDGNPIGSHTEIVTVQKLVPNPNWDKEQTEKREADFKSKFFEIQGYGWYRKQPKGYTSAVESLNTAFNAVTIMQQLPANMLIFYQAPDFTKPEECTEEWLIEHQIFNQAMTAQEFGQFYVEFMTAWNNQEHVKENENV